MTWTVQQQNALATLAQLSAYVTKVDDVEGRVDLMTIPYWPRSESAATETWTVLQQEE